MMTEASHLSVELILEALDRLACRFTSAVMRGGASEIDPAIGALLEDLGGVMGVDHVSVSGQRRNAAASILPRTWGQAGSAAPASIVAAAGNTCALSIGSSGSALEWPTQLLARLQLLTDLIEMALCRNEQASEIARLKSALEQRVDPAITYCDADDAEEFEEIIGDSPALRAAIARCQEVAPTRASVVLFGETGTGKELFARAVHNRSPRHNGPFVRVNCAALPPTLIESELFGHERGAFTGAVSTRQGRFEVAHKGTLFLDEIGDLPHEVQAKLLRVLQEGEFERVGSSQSRKVDVRVIAATHRDLDAAVVQERFRADLYYRLNVFPIVLPPLRERPEDIPRLMWFFINRRQRALDRKITRIPAAVLDMLQRHSWPGNVRELENVIERAMIHSTGDTLVLDDAPGVPDAFAAAGAGTLEAVERLHIESVLRRSEWRINGAGNAAERLGLHPNTLRFRMKKLGIRRPQGPTLVRNLKRLA